MTTNILLFLGQMGPWQIAIIVIAILLLFGAKRIPELMKGLGSGVKEFKKGLKEEDVEGEKKEKLKKS